MRATDSIDIVGDSMDSVNRYFSSCRELSARVVYKCNGLGDGVLCGKVRSRT